MKELNLATPALLFPAVSLLLLAYTNRFLALAALIRSLYDRWRESPDEKIVEQIGNLRRRLKMIRNMQFFGVFSMLLCVVSMFCVYEGWGRLAGVVVVALNVELADMETEQE